MVEMSHAQTLWPRPNGHLATRVWSMYTFGVTHHKDEMPQRLSVLPSGWIFGLVLASCLTPHLILQFECLC